MSSSMRLLVFSILLGVLCSALLAGVSWFTEPYRTANEKAEAVSNILSALRVPVAENATADQTLEIFSSSVSVREAGGLDVYEYRKSGALEAVAVSVRGPGLWGPVEGVLALESDLRTIRGVRFFKQEETPGLGGEIGAEWFQSQFVGKKIVGADGVPGVRVVKSGSSGGPNVVDAITGATMTSQRVEMMLNNVIDVLTGEL